MFRLRRATRKPGGRPAWWVLAAGCLLAGCPAAPTPRTVAVPEVALPGLTQEDRRYLVDPLLGYPGVPQRYQEETVREAFLLLTRQGRVEEARDEARNLLAIQPVFPPATVLLAAADFVSGDFRSAQERLSSLVQEFPGYIAAQLLLGRVAERLGDLPRAYLAYRAVAEVSDLARERSQEIFPRVVEIGYNRIQDVLARGHVEEAEGHLQSLQEWAPEETLTWLAAARVAEARGDTARELEALRRLTSREPERRDLLERRAELELEGGDPRQGIQIYQALAERYPNDPELASRLEMAKFRWRVYLLPAPVQELAGQPEVTRAGFAVLLYWLVPKVRYGVAPSGRIASDILEHPRQREVARVVNLGFMQVDPTLHRFHPDRPVSRNEALGSLLEILGRFGKGLGCLQENPAGLGSSVSAICQAAAACRLIATEGDCLPRAPLSGTEALELIRRTLRLLGDP